VLHLFKGHQAAPQTPFDARGTGSRDNKFNAAVGSAPISGAPRRTRGGAASAYDAEV